MGAPRSGTTMLRLALNAHPEIGIGAETEFFPRHFDRHCGRPGGWQVAVEAFLAQCERKFRPPIELGSIRDRLLALPQPDYRALFESPLAAWAAAEGKARWGEKTPAHIFHADKIVAMFPGAKFVHLIRDPRAVVSSLGRFELVHDDVTLNAIHWRDTMTKGVRILEGSVAPEDRLVVRYEALVVEPEETLREVCGFLGHEFDPGMLSFHETSRHYLGSVHTEKVTTPIRPDLEGWRLDLGASEIAVIEAVCAEPMKDLGYVRAGRGLTAVECAQLARKQLYVKVKQRRHHAERYHRVTYPGFNALRRGGFRPQTPGRP